jgi:hypothetical protein
MKSTSDFRLLIAVGALFCAAGWVPATVMGQDKSDEPREVTARTETLELGGGVLVMEAPAEWTEVEPRFNMIDAEFSIAKQGEDEIDARLTIMAAGGSVKDNIDRWASQFSLPDGGSVRDAMKTEEIEVDGMKTHLVDVSGIYADRPGGPTDPPTMRENWRLLGAVVETDEHGTWFFKFYGGADTIKANEEAFRSFIKSLKKRV